MEVIGDANEARMGMAEGISWLVVSHPLVGAGENQSPGHRPQLRLLPEPLEFRLLGPVEVLRGGERLVLGGQRQLAVLAVLVIDAGRVVTLDRLVDALWGDRPPPGTRATLHAYLSKLRRTLEPTGRVGTKASVLATRGQGYMLDVDPDTIDVRRFARLATEGRAALAGGNAEMAAERFAEALGLWRGPALADFTFERFAAGEIARLEELHLSVLEDHLDAALALGRHRAVVADLEPLVSAHPFRERLRAQLMIALYRSGRQAEALRTYQAGRRLLAEELGIDPSPTLKALEGAILRQDNDLDWTVAAHRVSRPGATRSVPTGPRPETVTFLRSELDGVAPLAAEDRTRAAELTARHRFLVTEAAAGHGGHLCDETGPGTVVAVFPRASEALTAALTLQRTLAAETWPHEVTIHVSIGVPTDVVVPYGREPAGDLHLPPHHPQKRGVA